MTTDEALAYARSETGKAWAADGYIEDKAVAALAAEVDRLRNHLVMQDDAIDEANSLRLLLDTERSINVELARSLETAKRVIEHRDAEIQRLEARIAQLTSDAP